MSPTLGAPGGRGSPKHEQTKEARQGGAGHQANDFHRGDGRAVEVISLSDGDGECGVGSLPPGPPAIHRVCSSRSQRKAEERDKKKEALTTSVESV